MAANHSACFIVVQIHVKIKTGWGIHLVKVSPYPRGLGIQPQRHFGIPYCVAYGILGPLIGTDWRYLRCAGLGLPLRNTHVKTLNWMLRTA